MVHQQHVGRKLKYVFREQRDNPIYAALVRNRQIIILVIFLFNTK